MGAVASMALAVGSALFLLGGLSVVVLCRMALREGAEFEAEITARSFRLKLKPQVSWSIQDGRPPQSTPMPLGQQHDRGDVEK